MLISNAVSSGSGGGPGWWVLCHLQAVVSEVALGVSVRPAAWQREGVEDCLGGFSAPGLGGELVTKVKGVMVERRHSLGGRCIWGVWGLECTGCWRGLRRVRQDLCSPRTEQNNRPLLLP